MDPNYVESILILNERGDSDAVRPWLVHRGFSVTPMRAGFLVSGPKDNFETTFSVDLAEAEPPIQLPIPREISRYVASFGIPKPRQVH
jgi:hypothetical protein